MRRITGRWTAFGLPYAGSSGIYRQASAPVAAVFVLGQAEENRVRPLGPAEAARMLLPELTLHRWDPLFVEEAMDILLALLAETPVWRLDCLPDRSAVALAKETICKGDRAND